MTLQVHPQSSEGFSGDKGKEYDRVRPTYPADGLSYLRKHLGQKGTLNIVEIGAGTGILTRDLLKHPDWATDIAELKAIDPSEGMRTVFAEATKDERVSIANGTFENTGVQDGWADLIIIATAFHWCLDFDAALSEFARILKPDGVVCLTWNTLAGRTIAWVKELWEIPSRYDPERHHENQIWRPVYNSPCYDAYFEPSEEKTFPHYMKVTPQDVIDRVLTWSAVAIQEDEEKDKIKEEVKEIIHRGYELEWADANKGLLMLPHATLMVFIHRKCATL